ncbi:hypothetical protein P2R53_18180 [Priestia megaterium]|nr:hypothetical protein [Priestia megaterium]
MAVLIMATDSIFFRTNFNPYNYYLLVGIGAICLLLILANFKIFVKKTNFNLALLMCITIFTASLIHFDTDFLIFYKLLVIAMGLYLFIKWNVSKIADIYVSVMVFIALFSIVGVLSSSFIVSNPIFPILNDGEYGTKTAVFYNIRLGWDQSQSIYFRNQGPFWEPGAFQAYLNIAVFFQFFLLNRKYKHVELLILVVSILTTLSTTGIMVLCLLILAKSIESKRKEWKSNVLYFITIFIILAICLFNNNINEELFSKFDASSTSIISSQTRKESILINLKMISQNPFTGFGITKGSSIYNEISSLSKNIDQNVNTTTLLFAWSIFGIVYAFLSTYSYIRLGCAFVNKTSTKVLIISAIIIILNTEDWTYSLWFNILLIYGLMIPNLKILKST